MLDYRVPELSEAVLTFVKCVVIPPPILECPQCPPEVINRKLQQTLDDTRTFATDACLP
jgi:hypothetical protein